MVFGSHLELVITKNHEFKPGQIELKSCEEKKSIFYQRVRDQFSGALLTGNGVHYCMAPKFQRVSTVHQGYLLGMMLRAVPEKKTIGGRGKNSGRGSVENY